MQFNEAYYTRIWPDQGVHRNDYVRDRANQMVDRYGVTSYLDVGCGCGALVKELRNRGCDAWGVEISDYALANTCVPGSVLKGSLTNIPFRDKRFDVLHTMGVWEYVPEAEIYKAVAECYRVAGRMDNNIDYLGAGVDEENFATARPREWWDEKLDHLRILVAMPMHERKEYSFQKWIDCAKALDYPWYDILVVENSPG